MFHWAFIEGENDGVEAVARLGDWISASGIEGRFNLVRYNRSNEPDQKRSGTGVSSDPEPFPVRGKRRTMRRGGAPPSHPRRLRATGWKAPNRRQAVMSSDRAWS